MMTCRAKHPGTRAAAGYKRRLRWAAAGLAMLELVLALPLLVLMMALIINYGTVAAWKVRGLAVARHSVWSTRWPRSGGQLPRPEYWPASASMGASGLGRLDVLDDPRLDNIAIRGPLPNGFVVRDHLLDPGRGVSQGAAGLTRQLPLLTSVRPYHLSPRTQVIEYFWDHQEIGPWYICDLRTSVLYELPKAPPQFAEAYRQAAFDILRAPFRADLAPLDRDDEAIAYHRRFPWRSYLRDFHPDLLDLCGSRSDFPGVQSNQPDLREPVCGRRFVLYDQLRSCCTTSHSLMQERVSQLIDLIEGWIEVHPQGIRQRRGGVPQVMAENFIRLYGQVIAELQLALRQGNLPPDVANAYQAEIRDLQNRITHLERFLNELRNAVD